MTLTIEETMDGFYSLKGCGCTVPEGFASEWAEVAIAIREKRSVSFKRLAYHIDGHFGYLSSPRNAYGRDDCESVWHESDVANELADEIERVLSADGNPVMFSDRGFDPVELGC